VLNRGRTRRGFDDSYADILIVMPAHTSERCTDAPYGTLTSSVPVQRGRMGARKAPSLSFGQGAEHPGRPAGRFCKLGAREDAVLDCVRTLGNLRAMVRGLLKNGPIFVSGTWRRCRGYSRYLRQFFKPFT
jgi:hypothetical protein